MPPSSLTEVSFQHSADTLGLTASSLSSSRYLIEPIPHSFTSSSSNNHQNQKRDHAILGFTKVEDDDGTMMSSLTIPSNALTTTNTAITTTTTSTTDVYDPTSVSTKSKESAFTSSAYINENNIPRFIRTSIATSTTIPSNSSNHNVMCVSGMKNCNLQSTIYIDFTNIYPSSSSNNNTSLDIIHTRTFYINEESFTENVHYWKIACVDSQANLILLQLDCDTLQPFQITYIPSIVISSSTTTLSKSQITFPSHNQFIYIHPQSQQMIHYHISSKSYTIWKSIHQCLDVKKKSLGYLTCAKGLLLGKSALDIVSNTNEEMDGDYGDTRTDNDVVAGDDGRNNDDAIPPTIALCNMNDVQPQSNDSDMDDDIDMSIKTITSLHIDGSIRLWTLLPISTSSSNTTISKMKLYPLRVQQLKNTSKSEHWNKMSSMLELYIASQEDGDVGHSLSMQGASFDDTDEGMYGMIGLYIPIQKKGSIHQTDERSKLHSEPLFAVYSFQQSQTNEKIHTTIHDLALPQNIDTVVGMDFTTKDNTKDGFELNVLFDCKVPSSKYSLAVIDEYSNMISKDVNSIHLATYQPFQDDETKSDSLKLNPTISHNGENNPIQTMDTLAFKRREDIIAQAHVFMENVHKYDVTSKDDQGEEREDELNWNQLQMSIDAMYMKQIFRPCVRKKIGCHSSIYNAMKNVVSSLSLEGFDADIDILPQKSLELQLIRLMKEWSLHSASKKQKCNDYMDVDMSPPSMIGEGTDTEYDNDPVNGTKNGYSMSNEQKVLDSHKRWTTMLLCILDEEVKSQRPLSFTTAPSLISNTYGGFVLRAGCTTQLCVSKLSNKSTSPGVGQLDELGTKLLSELEQNESGRDLLVDFELKIWDIISKAKLIFGDEMTQIHHLIVMLAKAVDFNSLSSICSLVRSILGGMKVDDIVQWLLSPLSTMDERSSLLEPTLALKLNTAKKKDIQPSTIVPFAVKIASQHFDRIYKLSLGRCILLVAVLSSSSDNIFESNEVKIATRVFLQAVSMIWLHSQLATIPSAETSKEGSSKVPPILAFSPVSKKARTEGHQSKVEHMILQYALQDHYVRTGTFTSCNDPVSEVIALSKNYIETLFTSNELPSFIKQLSNGLRLSLRLLAPLASSNKSKEVDGNLLVEGLLAEVTGLASCNCLSEKKARQLLEHASNIMYKQCVNVSIIPQKHESDKFVSVLRSLPDEWISSTAVSSDKYYNDNLATLLSLVLKNHSAHSAHSAVDLSDDVADLCNMDTVKTLMLPWIVVGERERQDVKELIINSLAKSVSDPERVFVHSLLVLLRISKMMRFMTMFESRVDVSTNNMIKASYSHTLLPTIIDTIREIESNFSSDTCEVMTEYVALWSAAFRHAVIAQQWNEAFKACLSNPYEERRVKNFQRLVLAMVEAGEINKLINKILFTVVEWQTMKSGGSNNNSSNVIDLYELASEALVQAASERSSMGITQGNLLSKPKVNYAGCLYTLHASHNEWRRCCQVMDFYGILSQANLMSSQEFLLSTDNRKECDLKCINDKVLSSVTSSQLIHLIPKKNTRYIVSGELGPDVTSPPFRTSSASNILGTNIMPKRMRENESTPKTISGEVMEVMDAPLDRSSRLLTESSLSSRATRYMALRTLFNDTLSPESLSAIIQSSDRQLIEALSRLGYYSHVIAIGNCKKQDENGACPGGRDVVADAISHMICNYILPHSVRSSRCVSGEESIDEGDGIEHRPTLNQLRVESGVSPLVSSCDLWRSDSRNKEVEKASIAFDFVRNLISTYSNKSNSLSLEVAQTLIDLDSGNAKLPLWLHQHLIGNIGTDASSDGLFAKSNPADPSALIRLYMKNGLLSSACEVVIEALTIHGTKRKEEATKRLPEKGCIEFVPYVLIDKLWNMIEFCLQSTECDQYIKDQLIRDRNGLEKALEFHFRLLKVGEMGIISTRALNPSVVF